MLLNSLALERQPFDARNVARLVCRRPEGGRAVMSDEMWKGRACSGIPKNVGGSIKREHVAAFDVCQGSPCRPHNPGIGTIAGGSAQYTRLGPIASGPPGRHRTVHRMVFRDSHPCGKLSANWSTRFLMRISLIVHHLRRQARNRFSEHLSEMAVFCPSEPNTFVSRGRDISCLIRADSARALASACGSYLG